VAFVHVFAVLVAVVFQQLRSGLGLKVRVFFHGLV
jgi:hypothetical protein